MKIEIELLEVEKLRDEISRQANTIKKLEDQLKSLDEKELKHRAVELSKRLFDNYMECVFRHLGFEKWQRSSVDFKDNLEHWLGQTWWNSERLEINIGASISKQWSYAFLTLGIVPKPENDSENEEIKL